MKKLFLFICGLLIMMTAIPVRGSVVGDGYTIIGGEEELSVPVQQTAPQVIQQPVQPPVQQPIQQPSISQSVHKASEEKEIEKVYERKKPPAPKKKEEISGNSVEDSSLQQTEKKTDSPREVLVISIPGEPVVEEDPLFDMRILLRILKVIATIVGCYFVVFFAFSVLFMPRFYVCIDDKYHFAAFLFLSRRENGYYIRIPQRIVKSGATEGKIIFKRSREGEMLEVTVNREILSYPFEKEVMIYFDGEE